MLTAEAKAQEARIRRKAARRGGWTLRRSRRRDRLARDFGMYWLIREDGACARSGFDLDELEKWLDENAPADRPATDHPDQPGQ